MKKTLSVFSIMAFLILWNVQNTQAQRNKMPKGKWITQMNMGLMNMQMTANFASKTLKIEAVINNQPQKEKTVILDILDSKVSKKQGKFLIKEQGKEKYAIGLFKRLSKDELVMFPPEPHISNRKEAEEFYKNAEKKLKEEMTSKTPGLKTDFNIYEIGFLFRTEKRTQALRKLPEMPDLDKKGVLKMMDKLIEIYKDPKNKALLGNPMSSLRLMDQLFLKQGYNPYSAFGKMMKSQMKFATDKDVPGSTTFGGIPS